MQWMLWDIWFLKYTLPSNRVNFSDNTACYFVYSRHMVCSRSQLCLIMEYTYIIYRDMLLLHSTSNSQTGTNIWENTLCYPDRFHSNADVLPVEQHIHETGSLTCTVLENVDHTWSLWTPANEDTTIAAVKQHKRRRSCETTTTGTNPTKDPESIS